MSAPNEEKTSGSVGEISDAESSPATPPPPPTRQQRGRRTRQKKQGGALEKLPVDELPVAGATDTAQGALSGVTNTLGGVAGGALDKQGGGKEDGKGDTLRLRLDLNLDIEITLKARIHGDLELALL